MAHFCQQFGQSESDSHCSVPVFAPSPQDWGQSLSFAALHPIPQHPFPFWHPQSGSCATPHPAGQLPLHPFGTHGWLIVSVSESCSPASE